MGATRDRPAPEWGVEARERERERRGTRGRECPKIHSFDICVLLDSVLMARLSSTPLRFLLRAAVKKKRVVGTGGGKKKASSDERVKAQATFWHEEKG